MTILSVLSGVTISLDSSVQPDISDISYHEPSSLQSLTRLPIIPEGQLNSTVSPMFVCGQSASAGQYVITSSGGITIVLLLFAPLFALLFAELLVLLVPLLVPLLAELLVLLVPLLVLLVPLFAELLALLAPLFAELLVLLAPLFAELLASVPLLSIIPSIIITTTTTTMIIIAVTFILFNKVK